MSRQPRNPAASAQPATTRQNEYFVPRDGIDREVISADICRYLGNDALVRPGHYENPQTGQVVQGYYITAYRNLTTAMIEDLKADSARWDSERRAQTSRNTPGGIHASRDATGFPARLSSNSPAVQYRYSETHQSRQHHGPTEAPFQPESYPRESFDGASNAYQQPPPQQSFVPAQPGSMMRPGYQQNQDPPYIGTGANLPQSGYSGSSDPYSNRMAASAGTPQQPVYSTAPPPQLGYPAPAPQYQYQSQAPLPIAGGHSYPAMQPHDPFYGRARNQTPPSGSSNRRPDGDRQHRPTRR
ncbi:hypothetical protein UVI_02006170 [Ustilaginoidea virens]|uniref:Transcription factor RfeG n=1 Tax=Ustilaginoidea virens TaxID=1159556 RepID=A0A1B5L5M0_USTVR|nr:hypothetical protein UVI_02006170 [Ustilaginoidea virens]